MNELSPYMNMPVMMLKNGNLVKREAMHGTFSPLQKLANKYLPVAGISVPREKLFSEAGFAATKRETMIKIRYCFYFYRY